MYSFSYVKNNCDPVDVSRVYGRLLNKSELCDLLFKVSTDPCIKSSSVRITEHKQDYEYVVVPRFGQAFVLTAFDVEDAELNGKTYKNIKEDLKNEIQS